MSDCRGSFRLSAIRRTRCMGIALTTGMAGCSGYMGPLHGAKSDADLSEWLATRTPAGTSSEAVEREVRQAGAGYSAIAPGRDHATACLRPPWWQPCMYPYTRWIYFYFDQANRLTRAEITTNSGPPTPVPLGRP